MLNVLYIVYILVGMGFAVYWLHQATQHTQIHINDILLAIILFVGMVLLWPVILIDRLIAKKYS